MNNALKLTLPSDREIRLERTFKAPARLVFDVWTQPEHVRQWWGCDSAQVKVCDADLRVGGKWRYVLDMGEYGVHGFNGEYLEIEPGARLVHTQIYEPYPDHPSTVTVIFEESEGVTHVTETILHATQEGRDGHLQSGMEDGANQSLNRLEELLAKLQSEVSA